MKQAKITEIESLDGRVIMEVRLSVSAVKHYSVLCVITVYLCSTNNLNTGVHRNEIEEHPT